MKIFAISDLHLSAENNKPMDIFGEAWDNYWEKIHSDWNKKVSSEDIVLIAGDISWAMALDDARSDLNSIGSLPGNKIIIKGNHDYWWSSYSKVKSILNDNIYAIQNSAIKLNGCIFAGTRGWTVPTDKSDEQDKKIYNRELIRLEISLKEAKSLAVDNEPIILLTHYPPFNAQFCDNKFTDLIAEYNVKAVVYGHLHGKDCRVNRKLVKNNIPYYLTSCDLVNNELQLIYEL